MRSPLRNNTSFFIIVFDISSPCGAMGARRRCRWRSRRRAPARRRRRSGSRRYTAPRAPRWSSSKTALTHLCTWSRSSRPRKATLPRKGEKAPKSSAGASSLSAPSLDGPPHVPATSTFEIPAQAGPLIIPARAAVLQLSRPIPRTRQDSPTAQKRRAHILLLLPKKKKKDAN